MAAPTLVVGPDRTGRAYWIEGERVVRIVTDADEPPPEGVPTLECRGALVEAGRVNAHTHLYSGLAPLGMPAPELAPENFLQILERVWWRLDRALDADSLAASARLYVAEALLAGTTTLIDHHESPELIEGSLDVLSDACTSLGIRALLCYGATERNGGRAEAQRGLAECARLARASRDPRIVAAVGLHASFTVSDETVAEAGALCRELGVVMHVHVAEDAADVADARRRGFDGPLERLLALDALPAGSILAHGIHLDAAQVRLADERGLWFVHNPRSNAGNRVGYAADLVASDHVALGTDGYPARMDEEAGALAAAAAEHGQAPAICAARVHAGHELASARFGGTFGLLATPSAGDLRVVDGNGVRHVVVGGRVVVEGRKLLFGDLEAIRGEARSQARGLWERMERR